MRNTKPAARLEPRVGLLVDLENLCIGSCNVTPEIVANAAKNLLGALADAGIDLNNLMTTVAVGVEAIYRNPLCLMSWPNAPRLLQGHGVDGADERILDVLNNDPALRKSRTVIVASGDGIYSDAIADLNRLGIETIIASYPGSLSAKPKSACSSSIELVEPPSIEMGWIA